MITHLLVPLDGSRLAESALPAAVYLASRLHATITLLHVIEQDPPKTVHGEPHLGSEEEAVRYLDEVAGREVFSALAVRSHVHTGKTDDVAKGILEHLDEFKPDLCVMCTHGRSGLRPLLFGTIAQKVAGSGTLPVMLIPPAPSNAPPQPFALTTILVPLDGAPDHEQGLPIASELALACGASVHVLLVVPTLGTLSDHHALTGLLLPGATKAVLELSRQEGEAYLKRHVEGLVAAGIRGRAEICRGDPRKGIATTARRLRADLIVLGTHGRLGMEAFWEGSLCAKISSRPTLPMLLVPRVPS
jgi:nucleotide-binding universal stress UspA family protein